MVPGWMALFRLCQIVCFAGTFIKNWKTLFMMITFALCTWSKQFKTFSLISCVECCEKSLVKEKLK
jgi:hypothetical protein